VTRVGVTRTRVTRVVMVLGVVRTLTVTTASSVTRTAVVLGVVRALAVVSTALAMVAAALSFTVVRALTVMAA
jgi:hypothetical protein